MKKNWVKKANVLVIILLFVQTGISSAVGSVNINLKKEEAASFSNWNYEPDIIVPDDYPTIQEGINNAEEGFCIGVRNGTWNENILISKNKLTICGDLTAATTIQNVDNSNTISISARNITIADFVIISNASESFSVIFAYFEYATLTNIKILRNHIIANNKTNGLYFNNVEYANISYNILLKNGSMSGKGIVMNNLRHYVISKNKISNFETGICLEDAIVYSFNNDGIFSNKITKNYCGIFCNNSWAQIFYNEISYNHYGIYTNDIIHLLIDYFNPTTNIYNNNIINNTISIQFVKAIVILKNNNIINDDADFLVMMDRGRLVRGRQNYWGSGVASINPRRKIFPLLAPILLFPWRSEPVYIPQTWPD